MLGFITTPVCGASGQREKGRLGSDPHTKCEPPKSVIGIEKNSLYRIPVYTEKMDISRMQYRPWEDAPRPHSQHRAKSAPSQRSAANSHTRRGHATRWARHRTRFANDRGRG
eukprot:397074-Pyramimonas_sp.AAC.1